MKILVTGAAGFIGYHLCKSLLEDDYEVLGIDNLNDYYDPNLKLARLDQLKPYENFTFEKVDIADRDSLTQSFRSFNPQKVVNLAAQPVRLQLVNTDPRVRGVILHVYVAVGAHRDVMRTVHVMDDAPLVPEAGVARILHQKPRVQEERHTSR